MWDGLDEAITILHIPIWKKLSSPENLCSYNLLITLEVHQFYCTTWGFVNFLKETKEFQQFPKVIVQSMLERTKRNGLWSQLHTWISHAFKSCFLKLKKNSVTIIPWVVLLFIVETTSSPTSSLVCSISLIL